MKPYNNKTCSFCGDDLIWVGSLSTGRMECSNRMCELVHRMEGQEMANKGTLTMQNQSGNVGDEWEGGHDC